MQLGLNAPQGTWCPCNIEKGCRAPLNATGALLKLRPQFVRTHDVSLLSPATFSINPPNPLGVRTFNYYDLFPSLDADPADPSSYNFSGADEWAAQWNALDVPLLVRFGTSWFSSAAQASVPAEKVEVLADAFLHFVMHFNDGWGGGRAAKHKVRYWEVWNEPEGSRFWTGNKTVFHELLALTVLKLRAYDPTLRVGPNNACPGGPICASMRQGYEFEALDAALSRGARPNLYSWHEYIVQNPTLSDSLYDWTAAALTARNLTDVEQIITEWNPCNGACVPPYQIDAWAAADFAQTVMVHATLGVRLSAPYPLCATNSDWGLLSTETVPAGAITWRPQAHAFEMMSEILRAAPFVIGRSDARVRPWQIAPGQTDDKYFSAAWSSSDGRRVSVVFVARMQTSDAPAETPPIVEPEVLVSVRGLKSSTQYHVSAFVIDNSPHNNEQVGVTNVVESDATGMLQMPHSYPCVTPTVLHIKIEEAAEQK